MLLTNNRIGKNWKSRRLETSGLFGQRWLGTKGVSFWPLTSYTNDCKYFLDGFRESFGIVVCKYFSSIIWRFEIYNKACEKTLILRTWFQQGRQCGTMYRMFSTRQAMWYNVQNVFNQAGNVVQCTECFQPGRQCGTMYRMFSTRQAMWYNVQNVFNQAGNVVQCTECFQPGRQCGTMYRMFSTRQAMWYNVQNVFNQAGNVVQCTECFQPGRQCGTMYRMFSTRQAMWYNVQNGFNQAGNVVQCTFPSKQSFMSTLQPPVVHFEHWLNNLLDDCSALQRNK